MTAEALDRRECDADAAAYAADLVLAFNAAGWVWQVSAVDCTGHRRFRADRDGVTVVSDRAGVWITVDVDGSGVSVTRAEFPRGTPVADVLAVATDAANAKESA